MHTLAEHLYINGRSNCERVNILPCVRDHCNIVCESSHLISSTLNKNTIQLEHCLNLKLGRLRSDRWHTINKGVKLATRIGFWRAFCSRGCESRYFNVYNLLATNVISFDASTTTLLKLAASRGLFASAN